ncbi:MAG: M23 family metallopeptidase, partial [Dethiobacteria bacterium]
AAVNLTEVSIVEDLDLEVCSVSPESLYSADEIIVLLSESEKNSERVAENKGLLTFTADTVQHSTQGSRFSYDRDYDNLNANNFTEDNTNGEISDQVLADLQIHVKTVEEITVIESIPFNVEYVEDNNLFINQSEITTEGIDGEREVLYQITRENGLEVERLELEDNILVEPVNQVEKVGQKLMPASGGGSFLWPVQGEGMIYNGFKPGHSGVDIDIASGTNVLAADSGTVFFSGWGGTQGNYLILHHGAYWTLYLHNSVNLVSAGDRVTRGQIIAKVGSTGRSTGPHLHFEVRVDDGSRQWASYYQHQPVDPMQFYNRR